jgi:hypothetical protein
MPLRYARGVRPGSVAGDSDSEIPVEYQMGAASYYSGPAMAVTSYATDGSFTSTNPEKKDWTGGYEPDDPDVVARIFGVRFKY